MGRNAKAHAHVLVAMPREMHRRLMGLAASEETSVTDLIRESIADLVGMEPPARSRRKSPFDSRHKAKKK